MIAIVDGNNLAYRSFYTPMGSLTTSLGKASGCIMGLLNQLKALQETTDVERIIVMWDSGKAEWRKELHPEYKANRSYGKTEEEKVKFDELYSQMNTLHEMLPMIGIHSIKMDVPFEADDLIYGATKYLSEIDEEVLVVTSDKDMYQLIGDKVSLYTPTKKKVIGISDFYDEVGVRHSAYMGYRALLGDTSDNISGVPGIGEKTAKNLMDKYGHIDNVLNPNPADKKVLMKSKRTARIFEEENLQIIGRNHRIMNFKYVDEHLEKIDFLGLLTSQLDGELAFNGVEFRKFLTEWQFVSILSDFNVWSGKFRLLY